MARKTPIEAAADRAATQAGRPVKKRSGGASALADLIGGVSRQVVEHWIKAGSVPAHRVPAVSKATGLSYHELNPTVFPRE